MDEEVTTKICNLEAVKANPINYVVVHDDGITLLHIVAGFKSNDSAAIATRLLGTNADPNVRTCDGSTPVHIATAMENHPVLETLLKHGGNPFLKDNEGKSAFEMALEAVALECLNLFLNLSQNCTEKSVSDIQECESLLQSFGLLENVSKHLIKDKEKDQSDGSLIGVEPSTLSLVTRNNTLENTICLDSDYSTITLSSNQNGSSTEIYTIFRDSKENITLVEQHVKNNMTYSILTNESHESDWKSFQTAYSSFDSTSSSSSTSSVRISEDLLRLSNSQIYTQLKALGDHPGPVENHSRQLYLKRLMKLKSSQVTPISIGKYSTELNSYLDDKWDLKSVERFDVEMAEHFEKFVVNHRFGEGRQRCFFNYFLLDPRITRNLPQRSKALSVKEAFKIFLNATFYVGKGTRGRPYSHLYEAVKAMPTLNHNTKLSDKVKHILDIWKSELGVISVHCLQNSISCEALTREAAIIEAMCLDNLTNIKKGSFYGVTTRWTISQKRKLGVLLLCKAFNIFLFEGERLIRPKDL